MTKLLNEAFETLRQQSPDVQDCVAQLVSDALADEKTWNELFDSPKSENWLADQAAQIRATIKSGDTTDFDAGSLPE